MVTIDQVTTTNKTKNTRQTSLYLPKDALLFMKEHKIKPRLLIEATLKELGWTPKED